MERAKDLAPAFRPPQARPHESIRWALTVRSQRADTLPQRGTPMKSLMLMGMTEALITITVGELLRMIELDLKDRLERFLRSGHRQGWWMQLDTRVRRNAENRRKWTVAEIGTRRVARLESTDWLSMGDVLRCLRNLALTGRHASMPRMDRYKHSSGNCVESNPFGTIVSRTPNPGSPRPPNWLPFAGALK